MGEGMMLNLNDTESIQAAIEGARKEIDIIKKYGWATWKSVYHSTLEEKHISSYLDTLQSQIEYLTKRHHDKTQATAIVLCSKD